MLSLYAMGTLGICTLMMTIAREVFLFLAPPEYLAGIGLLGIMQLRWIFTMGVYIIDPGTAKSGKTWWVSIMLGLAVLVNIGVNLILTPKMGLYGAVIAELLGYVTAMGGRWIVSNRLFPIRWNYRYFWGMVLLYCVSATLQTSLILSDYPSGISFLLRFILAAGFFAAAWLTMDADAKAILISILNQAKGKLSRKSAS